LIRRLINRSFRTSSSSWRINSKNSAWVNECPAASCSRTSRDLTRPESLI
jgi:hypothetical protein